MLYTIIGILILLWIGGMLTSYFMDGGIHILLLLAVMVLTFEIILGKNESKKK